MDRDTIFVRVDPSPGADGTEIRLDLRSRFPYLFARVLRGMAVLFQYGMERHSILRVVKSLGKTSTFSRSSPNFVFKKNLKAVFSTPWLRSLYRKYNSSFIYKGKKNWKEEGKET